MSGQSIAWSPVPLVPDEPVFEVLRVSQAAPVDCWILSQRIEGVAVHFNGFRTLPCTLGKADDGSPLPCWHPHTRQEDTRWQGWIAVSRVGKSEVRLVCLSPSVLGQNRGLMKADSIRGLRAFLSRIGAAVNARMTARIWKEDFVPPLATAPDIRRALTRMWDAPLKDRNAGL